MESRSTVRLVTHGPNCLDGTTCAVVAARYFTGKDFKPFFASNREVDDVILGITPDDPGDTELWITDISWSDEETTRHLNALVEQGLALYWVDHHRSAVERRAEGKLDARFTDFVLSTEFAASRLLYDHLMRRTSERGESRPGLLATRNLVLTADDVDRWILEVDISRDLALAIRALSQKDSYRALLAMDSRLKFPAKLEDALERARGEIAASIARAERTRAIGRTETSGVGIVSADCDGYTGEVAEAWQGAHTNTIFALYDRWASSVSFRRTTDCQVDLSRLASLLGGGGHEAAAGCEMDLSAPNRPEKIVEMVAAAYAEMHG